MCPNVHYCKKRKQWMYNESLIGDYTSIPSYSKHSFTVSHMPSVALSNYIINPSSVPSMTQQE